MSMARIGPWNDSLAVSYGPAPAQAPPGSRLTLAHSRAAFKVAIVPYKSCLRERPSQNLPTGFKASPAGAGQAWLPGPLVHNSTVLYYPLLPLDAFLPVGIQRVLPSFFFYLSQSRPPRFPYLLVPSSFSSIRCFLCGSPAFWVAHEYIRSSATRSASLLFLRASQTRAGLCCARLVLPAHLAQGAIPFRTNNKLIITTITYSSDSLNQSSTAAFTDSSYPHRFSSFLTFTFF